MNLNSASDVTSSGRRVWGMGLRIRRKALLTRFRRPPIFRTSHEILERKREFFIDNLLVQIHSIIEMILVDRPCDIGFSIPLSK